MPRHKNPVYARTLAEAKAARPQGRPSSTPPYQFYITFKSSDGLGTLLHRPVRAILSGTELAHMVSAIPVETVAGDPENEKAVIRVIQLLRGAEFNER